ncbi:MAG: hypothetical protein VKO00_08465 [Cyanobacteriota bacterium]|jgi:hypothetical protein|nr:hypothetical protein [Cyanobacteriota bacterium]
MPVRFPHLLRSMAVCLLLQGAIVLAGGLLLGLDRSTAPPRNSLVI